MNLFNFLDKSFYMIMGAVVLFLVADFLWHQIKVKNKGLQKVRKRKEDNKKKILELFDKKKEIYNQDAEQLLDVSDTTATNYLNELVEENKIKRHGERGRGVFYTK